MSSRQRQCHGDITTPTVRSRLRSPAGHSIYRSPLDRVTTTGGDQKDERELAGRVTRPCGTQPKIRTPVWKDSKLLSSLPLTTSEISQQ
jgi:hypothetical protein